MTPPCDVAIAAFVKTPGHSPLKTRLAAGIGREEADRFYELAVAAIEATLLVVEANDVAAYWAVAESAAADDRRWSRLPRVAQGDGSLADRLIRVTESLHERYDSVVVIGADSPQLTPEELLATTKLLTRQPPRRTHVIGRTYDGGFYLFGGSCAATASAWQNAKLGQAEAAETLLEGLDPSVPTIDCPRHVDVDSASDLRLLRDALTQLRSPSDQQQRLLAWLDSQQPAIGSER